MTMGSTVAQMVHLEASDREASSASEVKGQVQAAVVLPSNFTWEKLSPSEFQQLQDFAACEYFKATFIEVREKQGKLRSNIVATLENRRYARTFYTNFS